MSSLNRGCPVCFRRGAYCRCGLMPDECWGLTVDGQRVDLVEVDREDFALPVDKISITLPEHVRVWRVLDRPADGGERNLVPYLLLSLADGSTYVVTEK